MSRTSTALPALATLAGLVLVGCAQPRGSGLVTATATTSVRTTAHPGTPPAATGTPSGTAGTPSGTGSPGTATASPAREPGPRPEPAPPARTDAEAEAAVFELTNAERAANGCPALVADERLDVAARAHSADMAARNYFDHGSRDGRTFVDRVEAAGHPAPGAENIAAGQRTPEAVVAGWMASPGHRANILNCGLKSLGVGLARGGTYGLYWTQNFGW
ncbi:CAP domain-containing protein [Saccharothrix australiensis]|uniref:Uncharacterized protein YkwD n=1 Tax=Saccharothrix australiensis TaxID=2072 RepID=A0A495W5W2_9PSEU|nr:CAP domain-containing protein [Saccharothrix australiensis]RKT56195.1 uncharacterized protein YkwD [Saccharothrix australiensis]